MTTLAVAAVVAAVIIKSKNDQHDGREICATQDNQTNHF
jgi:hypothetical protein